MFVSLRRHQAWWRRSISIAPIRYWRVMHFFRFYFFILLISCNIFIYLCIQYFIVNEYHLPMSIGTLHFCLHTLLILVLFGLVPRILSIEVSPYWDIQVRHIHHDFQPQTGQYNMFVFFRPILLLIPPLFVCETIQHIYRFLEFTICLFHAFDCFKIDLYTSSWFFRLILILELLHGTLH